MANAPLSSSLYRCPHCTWPTIAFAKHFKFSVIRWRTPPPHHPLPRVLFATEARGFLASPHYLHMYAPLFFRATGLYIFFTLLLLWPLLNNLPAGTSTSHFPLTTSPFHPSHHSGLGVRTTETSGSDAAW